MYQSVYMHLYLGQNIYPTCNPSAELVIVRTQAYEVCTNNLLLFWHALLLRINGSLSTNSHDIPREPVDDLQGLARKA